MPKFTLTPLFITLGLAIQVNHAIAESVMVTGGWEMHTTITMQDPKTGQEKIVNNSTSKQCLSPDYIAQNPYLNPDVEKAKMSKKQATCTIADAAQATNSATWKMSCKTLDGHEVKVSINNTVSAHQVESSAEQIVTKDGKSVFAKIKVSAKHIGACTDNMTKL
jgi:putative transposon-encoded protein